MSKPNLIQHEIIQTHMHKFMEHGHKVLREKQTFMRAVLEGSPFDYAQLNLSRSIILTRWFKHHRKVKVQKVT